MNNNGNKNGNNENKRIKKLETRILLSRGRSVFDHELLRLIIYPACNEVESREVVERLIELFGNLGKVINADLYDLKNVTGMNDSAIARIFCVKETIDKILKGDLKKLSVIDNIEKIIKYLRVTIGQSRKENLRVMYLDQNDHLIHEYIQDIGTTNKTPFYIREIVKRGLLVDAKSAIIAHNHPSGNLKPSEEDEKNILELALACENVGIKLKDHIIITEKSHFSFYGKGLM